MTARFLKVGNPFSRGSATADVDVPAIWTFLRFRRYDHLGVTAIKALRLF
jgi:hypothetical protein